MTGPRFPALQAGLDLRVEGGERPVVAEDVERLVDLRVAVLVLERVEDLAQPDPVAPPAEHVLGDLAALLQGSQQEPPLPPGGLAELGRRGQRHVAARQDDGDPEHVGGRLQVGEQVGRLGPLQQAAGQEGERSPSAGSPAAGAAAGRRHSCSTNQATIALSDSGSEALEPTSRVKIPSKSSLDAQVDDPEPDLLVAAAPARPSGSSAG